MNVLGCKITYMETPQNFFLIGTIIENSRCPITIKTVLSRCVYESESIYCVYIYSLLWNG